MREDRAGDQSSRFSSGDVKLAYGELHGGQVIHINDVLSGLACGCLCPSCRSALVAVKGKRVAHHFRHHVTKECRGAVETALHKAAKQALEKIGKVRLPATQLRRKRKWVEFTSAQEFHFDSVRLEARLEGIVPDIIVSRDGHDLLVEIHVTHPCSEEKVARIESAGLSTIEIDLSSYRYDITMDEIVEALSKAPRHWIYNRRLAEEQQKIDRQEADEHQSHVEELTRRAIEARENPPVGGKGMDLVTEVSDAGYGHVVGIRIKGDYCFSSEPRAWQAFLVKELVIDPVQRYLGPNRALHSFSAKQAFAVVKQQELLRPGFDGFVADDVAKSVRQSVEDFYAPFRIVEHYLSRLEKERILEDHWDGWHIHHDVVQDWRERQYREEQKHRDRMWQAETTEEIRQKLRDILAKIPAAEQEGFDPDTWFHASLPQRGISPADMVERIDRHELAGLKMRLTAIMEMMSGEDRRFLALAGGQRDGPRQLYPLANDLLGLPLNEEYRRQAQLRETQAREKREAEAKVRIERLEHHARVVLEHESRTWLSQTTPALKGETPLEAAAKGSAGLAQVMDLLEREGKKRKSAARYRSELEKAATMRLGPGRAQLFLMTSHPALDRSKPWEYCVDSETLSRCLSLLSGPKR